MKPEVSNSLGAVSELAKEKILEILEMAKEVGVDLINSVALNSTEEVDQVVQQAGMDSGTWILVLAGLLYGGKKLYEQGKET